MSFVYVLPRWFSQFAIGMEFFFAILTLTIAYFAFKAYRITDQREPRLFSTGFLMISVSYLVWAFVNLYVINEIKTDLISFEVNKIALYGLIGLYAYMFLFVGGLVTLVYMTFKTRNVRLYSLILALSFAVIVSSANNFATFRLAASLLSLFVGLYYYNCYKDNLNKKTLLIMLSFFFLFLSSADFIFASIGQANYMLGHGLEFVAYALLLVSFVLTLRKK